MKNARKSRRIMQESIELSKSNGDMSKKSRRSGSKTPKREKSVKMSSIIIEEDDIVESPRAPPRDPSYKSKRTTRSVSSDPSTKGRQSGRKDSEVSRRRSKSSDGGDRRKSSDDSGRPKRAQSEAAFHKRREARIEARTVDAATAREISKRRQDLLAQREDDWIVKSVGGGMLQLEFATDDVGDIDDGNLEEFDEGRSVPADPINFLEDCPNEMTYGRLLAIRLMKYKWYNPKAGVEAPTDPYEDLSINSDDNDEKETKRPEKAKAPEEGQYHEERPSLVTRLQYPSLERAWAYFEHVTLPRYVMEFKEEAPRKNICVRMFRKSFCKANKKLDRAEPGENLIPTKLYSPIFTPLSQMGDFGLGVGLYFSTLRAITILMLLAGLINIPNFIYFAGDEYSMGRPGLDPLLKGSAICTNQVWVPCPTCTPADFDDNLDRLATTEKVIERGETLTLTFALLNDCDGATFQQGMVNYGTLIFVLLGVVVMNAYQKHMEVKYDEDEQTAQDYSVVITNPPPDASDPEEWRLFFRYNFKGLHTTACTIAVDNDLLVRSLVQRRECMRKIEMKVEPGTSLDTINLAKIAMEIEQKRTLLGKLFAMIVPDIPELYARVTILTAKIQGLAQQDYPVSHVFLTFETEAAQRQVLSGLSVGSRAAAKNDVNVMADHPTYLFRGKHLLRVEEPDEPSTVRWQDLNAKYFARMKQLVMTTHATFLAIAVIALLIWKLQGVSPAWAATEIAAANGIFPQIAKLMTMTESYASEGGKQTSLYSKIAFFRWVNTAVIITIITVCHPLLFAPSDRVAASLTRFPPFFHLLVAFHEDTGQ